MVIKVTKTTIFLLYVTIFLGTFWTIMSRFLGEGFLKIYPLFKMSLLAFLYTVTLRQLIVKTFYHRNTASILLVWIVFILFISVFTFHHLVTGTSPLSTFNHIQNAAMLYMPMMFVGYYLVNDFKWMDSFSEKVTILSVIVSIVAIIQFFLGFDALSALGMNMEIGDGGFGAHFSTAIDKDGKFIFRSFSTLMSHYELCSYLIFSGLLNTYLLVIQKKSGWRYFIEMCLILIALLVTYNITGWLLFIISISLSFFIYARFKIFKVPLFAKVGVIILLVIFLSTVGYQFIERFSSNTDLVSGKGNSLTARLLFFINSVQMIRMKPFGWGWGSADRLPYVATADNFYLWMTVLGGVVFTTLLIVVYIIPLFKSFLKINWIYKRDKDVFKYAVVIFVWVFVGMVAGLSNYFIAHDYATAMFFWFSVGLLIRIPDFIKEQQILKN